MRVTFKCRDEKITIDGPDPPIDEHGDPGPLDRKEISWMFMSLFGKCDLGNPYHLLATVLIHLEHGVTEPGDGEDTVDRRLDEDIREAEIGLLKSAKDLCDVVDEFERRRDADMKAIEAEVQRRRKAREDRDRQEEVD